jgi:ATP-dependent protease Clp ATPase subunit
MEDALLDLMFDIPSVTDVEEVIVDGKVITDKVLPKTTHKKKAKAS